MINISLPIDISTNSSEQLISAVNKLFETLPKGNVELQIIIKSFNPSSNVAEIEIPLTDKNINLVIKLPPEISKFDKAVLKIDFDNKTIHLSVTDNHKTKDFFIKLSDNLKSLLQEDFKIKNLKIIYTNPNNFVNNEDDPQTIPLKPIEILTPFMKGKTFEAFVLKDIPLQNKIALNLPLETNSLNNSSPKIPYNAKIMIEVIKITPPFDTNNEVSIEKSLNKAENIAFKSFNDFKNNIKPSHEFTDIDKSLIKKSIFFETSNKNYQEAENSSEINLLQKNIAQNLEFLQPFVKNNHENTKSFLENLNNLIDKTLNKHFPSFTDKNFEQFIKDSFTIKGIVISTPLDKGQKILISDIGVITVPELKEKIPFKSVIDLKIKNIIPFDRIFEEYTISDNEPYNSIEKIIKTLKDNFNTDLNAKKTLDKFIDTLPKIDNKILTKLTKFIKAIDNNNPYEAFDSKLFEELDNHLKSKEFLTKMLKEDFSSPFKIQSASQNNSFSMYILPLFHENNISKIWFYLFTPQIVIDDNKKEKKNEIKQRFLIDLTLSELGNLQFEGFVDEPNKKIDLIIKSKEEFKDEDKTKMNEIFIKSMQSLSYLGFLKFKKEEKMTKPLEEASFKRGYFA